MSVKVSNRPVAEFAAGCFRDVKLIIRTLRIIMTYTAFQSRKFRLEDLGTILTCFKQSSRILNFTPFLVLTSLEPQQRFECRSHVV